MKVPAISIVLLFLFLPATFGVDLGGSIANATAITGTFPAVVSFLQQDRASLWFDAAFGSYLRFALQGSYIFDLERPFFVDLDYINFYGVGQLSFNVGRFRFSDFTRFVLSHTLDGGKVTLFLPFLTVSVSVGFSGLVQRPVSTIAMSGTDVAKQADENVILGSPRLVEMIEVMIPELFLRQDLTVTVIAQQDLRRAENLITGGGNLFSQYFGVGLNGPLFASLFYSAYFYLGTGSYQQAAILSFLTGGKLRLYLTKVLFSRIELGGLFSSGDAAHTEFYEGSPSGISRMFVPISPPFFGLVFSPKLGNIFLLNLYYSLRPFSWAKSPALQNLQTSVKGTAFFRSTPGAISEGGIDTASTGLYLGTEVDVRIGFRPVSDLGAAIVLGMFIPNNSANSPFDANNRSTGYLARFELSISF